MKVKGAGGKIGPQILDPCFFISAELSDISSGNERTLKRWPIIKTITGGG